MKLIAGFLIPGLKQPVTGRLYAAFNYSQFINASESIVAITFSDLSDK